MHDATITILAYSFVYVKYRYDKYLTCKMLLGATLSSSINSNYISGISYFTTSRGDHVIILSLMNLYVFIDVKGDKSNKLYTINMHCSNLLILSNCFQLTLTCADV